MDQADAFYLQENTMNANDTLDNAALFDLDSATMDSPRLQAIKKFGIETEHSPSMDLPWRAVPMDVAGETLVLPGSVEELTAAHANLLEEFGIIFYAETEKAAQDEAIDYCNKRNK